MSCCALYIALYVNVIMFAGCSACRHKDLLAHKPDEREHGLEVLYNIVTCNWQAYQCIVFLLEGNCEGRGYNMHWNWIECLNTCSVWSGLNMRGRGRTVDMSESYFEESTYFSELSHVYRDWFKCHQVTLMINRPCEIYKCSSDWDKVFVYLCQISGQLIRFKVLWV